MAENDGSRFRPNAPASEQVIVALLSSLDRTLPAEYIEFLRRSNGGEGFIGDSYATLWPAENLVQYNREYQVQQYAPTLFLIGSNGGGEGYAFDFATGGTALFEVPFIGLDAAEARRVADSFAMFLAETR